MRRPPYSPYDSFVPVLGVVLFYLFIWIPIFNFFQISWREYSPWANFLLLTAVLIVFVKFKGLSLNSLGIKTAHWTRDLLIGFALGGVLIAFLPAMDWIISNSRMAESDLFLGADRRLEIDPPSPIEPTSLLQQLLLIPIIQQIFWIGFVLHTRIRSIPAPGLLFLGGLLFVLSQLDFSLGVFFLGMISVGLFRLTGAVYAGIVFNIFAVGAGLLCMHLYPKTITFLTFLF